MAGSAFKLGKVQYSVQNITSAAGTTTLLNNSDYYQYVTGSATQTVKLPDATTMVVGLGFVIINANSSGTVTVVDNGSNVLATLNIGQSVEFITDNIGSTNGVWIKNTGLSSSAGQTTITENAQSGTTYTFVSSDAGKLVSLANSAAVTATVPPNSGVAFPVGTIIQVISNGVGQVTIAPGAGVTIDSLNGYTNLAGEYAEATLIKTSTNAWYLFGELTNNFIVATGGTITTNGNMKVHTFTSSGSFVISAGSGTVSSLVVAGGGGSGGDIGAGGGAGGLIYTTPGASLGVGSYTVTVGAGGLGGNSSGSVATNGSNSQFNGMTAAVGGGGGASSGGTITGSSGGSGGGGGNGGSAGAGTAGQGFAGGAGNSTTNVDAGGGGGAGGAGVAASPSAGGNGGLGISNSITGTATFYASGGGGSGNANTNGTASPGGGGNANVGTGTSGTNGLGGGGGGGGNVSPGAPGGSGVVILSYQYM